MKQKLLTLLLAAVLLLSPALPALTAQAGYAATDAVQALPFSDTEEDAWYAEAVAWAVENGIVNGYPDGTFGVGRACTEAENVTMLWRAAGSPEPAASAGSAWYARPVAWLEERGGLSFTEDKLNAAETRIAFVQTMYLAVEGKDAAREAEPTHGFTDITDEVRAECAYADAALNWAAAHGVANGTAPGVFSPEASLTREQVVTLLYRFYATENKGIAWRIADREEGQKLRLGNTAYFDSLTENDIKYRLRKPDGTLDELRAFAAEEVRDFTGEEKAALAASIERIEQRLDKLGVVLPFHDEVVFVKTTMHEEGDAGAYTHKNEIYLGESIMPYATAKEQRYLDAFDKIILHEMFHCLSRNDAPFRAAMYALIGFTVGEEVPFSKEIRDQILSNPDVERYDNYATFTVDGVETKCIIVPRVDDYKPGYESFFDHLTVCLVPVDKPDRFIPADEVPDFYDRVGRNTGYVIAAEECMADNFSFAIVYGVEGEDWPNPEILQGVLDALR